MLVFLENSPKLLKPLSSRDPIILPAVRGLGSINVEKSDNVRYFKN